MDVTVSRTPRAPSEHDHRVLRALLTLALLGGLLAFLLLAPRDYRWSWQVWGTGRYAEHVLGGLWMTFQVSVAALVLGLAFGLAGGLLRLSRHWALNQVGAVYVELIRGTPLLVQILLAKYCMATAFHDVLRDMGFSASTAESVRNPVVIGIVVLGFFAGAYVAEIVRAAILSIDRGQSEAALAQGMTRGQVFRLVLFPQALRRMVPPMTGQFVSLVKDSSLLSAIAVPELMKRADEVRTSTYAEFEVLLPLAALYLVICFPLSRLARRLELRLAE